MIPVPEQWLHRARNIKVPFDAGQKFHPEYDGYSPGERRAAAAPEPLLLLVRL